MDVREKGFEVLFDHLAHRRVLRQGIMACGLAVHSTTRRLLFAGDLDSHGYHTLTGRTYEAISDKRA